MEENLNFPQPPYDNYNSESFLHVKFVVPHSGAASQFLTVGGHSLASLGGGTSTVLHVQWQSVLEKLLLATSSVLAWPQ
jgi:hypothetical protein